MANVAPQVCSGLMQFRRVFSPLLFIVKILLLPEPGLMPSACVSGRRWVLRNRRTQTCPARYDVMSYISP